MATSTPSRGRRDSARREFLGWGAVAVVIGLVVSVAAVTGGLRATPKAPTLEPGKSVTNHQFKITLVSRTAKLTTDSPFASQTDEKDRYVLIKLRVRNLGKEAVSGSHLDSAIQAMITPGGRLDGVKHNDDEQYNFASRLYEFTIPLPGHASTLQPDLTYPAYMGWKLEPSQPTPRRLTVEIHDFKYRVNTLSDRKGWHAEPQQMVAIISLPVRSNGS